MLKEYLFFFAFYYVTLSSSAKDKKNEFGTFNLTLLGYKSCKGPKQVDCSTSDVTIPGYNLLKYNLHVLKNTAPNKGKVVAKKSGVEILRFQMKNPCDHLFFKPLFNSLMNVTKDCVILKGHYEFSADVQKIAQNYWAGSFLFGNWSFKSLFYNDECNFYCSIIDAILFPND